MADSLHRLVNRYCAWYKLVRGWTLLQILLFSALVALGIFYLADKVFFIGMGYRLMPLLVLAAVLLILLGYVLFSRREALHVGYLVDRSARLKNLVTTGISVSGCQDEVAQAVIHRAEEALAGRTPRRLLPFRWHWTGKYMPAPALLVFVALMLPNLDVMQRKQRRDLAVQDQIKVEEGLNKLKARFAAVEEHRSSIDAVDNSEITDAFKHLANELDGKNRNDALLKLGEFENKYKEDFASQRNFEEAARRLDVRPDIRGLHPESAKDLKDLLNNLNRGNFEKAAEAMKNLAKQFDGSQLTADQKKALARELEKMASNMQDDGALGKELAEALRQMQASSEDLGDLLQQCQSRMGEFAKACEQSQALMAMKEGLQEAKRAMVGEMFRDFNAREVEQYMEKDAARLGALCGKCNGKGCFACDSAMAGAEGTGSTGGKGMGMGGKPPERATDTVFKKQQSPSQVNKGRILHQMFVTGIPQKGEALRAYEDVVNEARQEAAGSLARDRVPREYEEMIKSYFDSLDVRKDAQDESP